MDRTTRNRLLKILVTAVLSILGYKAVDTGLTTVDRVAQISEAVK